MTTPRTRVRRTPRVALATLVLVGLGACASPREDARPDVRISEIRAARAVVAEPAAELAEAGGAVVGAVERLRTEPPIDPEDRLEVASEVREELLPQLHAALSRAEDVELEGTTPDIAAARDAWDEILRHARELPAATLAELEAIERLAELDAALSELTAQWDEPGSRSQQISRFTELEEAARDLARDIDGSDVASCLETFDRRRKAARTVAERSVELRTLVEGYRGEEFDEVRSGFRQDPFGVGARLTELDADQIDCWREGSPLVAAWGGLESGLAALEAALNPPDL